MTSEALGSSEVLRGFVPRGPQITVRSPKMQVLVNSGAYIFGNFSAKADITIQRHEASYIVSYRVRCRVRDKACNICS